MDDVVLNKAAAIERCVRRVRQEHASDDANLESDISRQDEIVEEIVARHLDEVAAFAQAMVRRYG